MLFTLLNIFLFFGSALCHVSFYPSSFPYTTSSTRVALKVPHACVTNSTNKLSATFPNQFVVVPELKAGWIVSLNGQSITWTSTAVAFHVPSGFNDLFWVWVTAPTNYIANSKYYTSTIQYCYPSGEYDWTFTPTNPVGEPAPSLTIVPPVTLAPTLSPVTFTPTFKPTISQTNNGNNLSPIESLTIAVAVISIISLLMNIYNEYRILYVKKYTLTPKSDDVEFAQISST